MSKGEQTEQNFINSTPYQVQWNLQKFTSTNIYLRNDRYEWLALDRSAGTFSSAALEGRLSTFYIQKIIKNADIKSLSFEVTNI